MMSATTQRSVVAPGTAGPDPGLKFDSLGTFEIMEPALLELVAGVGDPGQPQASPLDNTLCFINGACYVNLPCLYPNAICH